MTDIFIYISILLILLASLVGVVIPLLPGIPLMFATVFIYSFLDKFAHLTTSNVAVFLILMIASLFVDYSSGLIGAKIAGASKKAILGGTIGTLIGLFFFPPLGAVLGLFIGVLVAEVLQGGKNLRRAVKAATGTLLGSLAGVVTNLMIGILFIILFSIYFFR
ncbi:MAG: DUF456 domain-containing protein [Patescibacteria group bacterium]|jgi:hypothetical protein